MMERFFGGQPAEQESISPEQRKARIEQLRQELRDLHGEKRDSMRRMTSIKNEGGSGRMAGRKIMDTREREAKLSHELEALLIEESGETPEKDV